MLVTILVVPIFLNWFVFLFNRNASNHSHKLLLLFLMAILMSKFQISEADTVAEDEKFSETEDANPAANVGTSKSSSESSLRDMPLVIKAKHFDQVLGSISPSVSDKVYCCHFLIYIMIIGRKMGAG